MDILILDAGAIMLDRFRAQWVVITLLVLTLGQKLLASFVQSAQSTAFGNESFGIGVDER